MEINIQNDMDSIDSVAREAPVKLGIMNAQASVMHTNVINTALMSSS